MKFSWVSAMSRIWRSYVRILAFESCWSSIANEERNKMTVDLKIRIENGAVTVTVGGQLLQANSQAASNGQVLTTKVVGAPPQEDPIGPGGPPQEDPIGPGGADGSGVVVVVPIVI